MSLHFLLDGYNIIHQIFADAADDLYAQRQALVDFVEQNNPQGGSANRVTIVFDGKKGLCAPRTCTVMVVFSGEKEADETIEQTVLKAANKKKYVVVTDDRKVQFSVKAAGASIWTVAEFKNKGMKGRVKKKTSGPKLSSSQMESINAELRDIWLKRDLPE